MADQIHYITVALTVNNKDGSLSMAGHQIYAYDCSECDPPINVDIRPTEIVHKPVSPEALEAAVRRVLADLDVPIGRLADVDDYEDDE